jgi:hypothetical protein
MHRQDFRKNCRPEGVREHYIICCSRRKRRRLARFKAVIWKLRATKVAEKWRCPTVERKMTKLYTETIDAFRNGKWREQFFSGKWLNVNYAVASKKAVNCINAVELISIGNSLFKVRREWENNVWSNMYMIGAWEGGVELQS